MRTAFEWPPCGHCAVRTFAHVSTSVKTQGFIEGYVRLLAALVCLLVASLAFSGCASKQASSGVDASEGQAQEEGIVGDIVLGYPMSAQGCRVVTIELAATRDQVARFVPAGFEPQGSELAPQAGLFLLQATWCEDDASGRGPFGTFELFVPIQPPNVPAQIVEHDNASRVPRDGSHREMDLYYVAAYTDSTYWHERYTQAGIPALDVVFAASLRTALGAAVAIVDVAADGETILSFSTSGPPGSDAQPVHRRQWLQSDHGLLLVEEVSHGLAGAAPSISEGAAQCTLASGTLFEDAVRRGACGASISDTRWDVERNGTAYWFHETFVGA